MKLIYFDAGNPQKKKELEGLAKAAGYDFVPVAAMQTGQKIGYLAGVSGYRETPLPVLALPPRIGGASPAVAQRRHCKICFLLRSPQRYPQNQTLLSKLL